MKQRPLKVILLIFIIEIIIVGTLCFVFHGELTNLSTRINDGTLNDISEINENIQLLKNKVNMTLVGSIALFAVTSIIISVYLSKMYIYPINKLLETAQKKETAEEIEIKTILLHMTDGIIAFGIDGKIALINPAAKNLLNISPEDDTFDDIFKKFNLNINMEKIIYLENWTSTEQKIDVDDKSVKVLFAPFRNEKDTPEGVIAVIQDITEHVKLDNMRKEFVADVSHELKTPITSIMGYADTLLEGEYDKQTQADFLGVIASESRRMARLVTDLLELSRIDSNRKKVKKEKFDLGELTKSCQNKLGIQIKNKGHNVDCFVTADVPPVYADKDDIERVILNILSNSIKYTPQNGNIKIYVGFVYNDAYIKIIDDGIGIPEEDLNRIFERFYRVDKSRTRELGGTGLGLSIAKEILDKNGGSIDIKSRVNKGTEVVIKIPTK